MDKLIGTIIFAVASITDWYDGYIARRLNKVSRWGQFMDPLADKILVSAAFIIFAYLKIVYWWMVVVIVIRDFLITFRRVYAIHRGKPIVTSILAKLKTTTQMILVFVLLIYINMIHLGYFSLISLPPSYLHWVTIAVFSVTFLTAFSGIMYLINNRSHVFDLYNRMTQYFA